VPLVPRAAARARPARHGRDLRSQEAVGDPPVDPDEPPAEPGGGHQHRQADGERGEQRTQAEQRERRQRQQGHGQRGDDVADRLPRGGHPAVEVQGCDHEPCSTVTSPELLSAWIVNGASGADSIPRTTWRPEALWASTR
jgi:hypothetical protein